MRAGAWSGWRVALVALLIACSSGGAASCDKSSPDGAGLGSDAGSDVAEALDLEADRRDAARVWASALCTRIAECNADLDALLPGSDACVSRFADIYLERWFAHGSTLTPNQVRECAAGLPTDCTEFYSYAFEGRFPEPCASAKGTLDDGSACLAGAQCSSGMCIAIPNSVCGSCGPAGDVGGPCTFGECRPGLVCAGGACAKYVELGGACSDQAPCVPWLRCSKGSCAVLGKTGEACQLDTECEFHPSPFWCHPVTKTCVPEKLATTAVCGWSDSAYIGCEPDKGCLFSDPTLAAPTGACERLPAPGEACLGAWGPPTPNGCQVLSFCLNGSCQYAASSSCAEVPPLP